MISHSRLRKLLGYEPATGNFRWLTSHKIAGYPAEGYWRVGVDASKYSAHRLAWFYVYGYWPKLIDHIDGDGFNNRISNLREATKAQNRPNYVKVHGRIPVRGVHLGKNGYFVARIRSKGKIVYQKLFRNLDDAKVAIIAARKKHHGKFLPLAERTIFLFFLMIAPALSMPCRTHSEAREKWPVSHLFWHRASDGSRCWDNSPRPSSEGYSPRPTMKLPTRLPDNVAAKPAEPPSGLERVTPSAPVADIYYPELIKGEMIRAYATLVWEPPWLSHSSILNWPLLIDVDRVPFRAWDKRIGQ